MPAKRPRTGGQPAAGQRGTILDFLQSASSAGDTSSQPPPGGSCPEQAVSDRVEYAGGWRQPGGAAAGGSQQADGEQRRSNQVGWVTAQCFRLPETAPVGSCWLDQSLREHPYSHRQQLQKRGCIRAPLLQHLTAAS